MSVTMVCDYAPTAKAPPLLKSRFNSDLQDTLDKIPQKDVLLVLGYFNARVGVLKRGDQMWHGTTVGVNKLFP